MACLVLNIVNLMFDLFSHKLVNNHFLRQYMMISFFCFAGIVHLYAQNQYSRFDHLRMDNGMSSDRIWCILRDSKDFLWISSDVGLDNYDSYRVKKYRHAENISGSI